MKLYTYTTERSLPRMALKGMPVGFPLYGSLAAAADSAEMEGTSKDPVVILEVDADGLDDILQVSGGRVEDVANMAREDIENDPELQEGTAGEEAAEKAYSDVYDAAWNISTVQEMIEKFDVVENSKVIDPSRIKVLGAAEVEYPEDIMAESKVTFDQKPTPLKKFQQPLVTRLLRSIFLPKHKLYGAGKRHRPAMGFISRFLPEQEEVEVEEGPPPDIVSEVPLVWAAGKTFQRGVRGAFGQEAGDAIAQLVSMRVGQEPGRYLGSGMKGAVYTLGKDRVLKVTMDGNEVHAAANLIGVRHPNLSLVHDVFVVTDGEKGSGFIVRDKIDTTLWKFDKDASILLEQTMDTVLDALSDKMGSGVGGFKDIDPDLLAFELENAIELLRGYGCDGEEWILLDIADAFRQLKYLGIVGVDFDARNVGVIKGKKPRAVVFDYGLTKSPPVHVDVISLSEMRM